MKHLPFGKYEVTSMPSWSKSAKSDLWSEAFSICRRNTSLAKRLHSRRLINVPKERFIKKTVDFYRNLPFFFWLRGPDLNQRPSGYEPVNTLFAISPIRPVLEPPYTSVFPLSPIQLPSSLTASARAGSFPARAPRYTVIYKKIILLSTFMLSQLRQMTLSRCDLPPYKITASSTASTLHSM